MYQHRHVTVIIPVLNEAPSIAHVVRGLLELKTCSRCFNAICTNPTSFNPLNDDPIKDKYAGANKLSSRDAANVPRSVFAKANLCSENCGGTPTSMVDQIIVGDNGSTDDSAAIATACGAMVVSEPERGYGAACLAALAAPVDKDIIVFVDGDHSVIAQELPTLLKPIVDGADLVIGSRTMGHCEKGALTVPQSIGNKLATALIQLLWRSSVTDLGPFRAITQTALQDLNMHDRQFGWTVEMQVKALQRSMNIVEVPVSTKRRIGRSKVSGTVKGVIGAAHGILGTIVRLYWCEKRSKQSTQIRKVSEPSETHIKPKSEKLT